MKKKFKIIFPHPSEQEAEMQKVEKDIRRNLKQIANGILAKVLIFTYYYQPISLTELTKILSEYYKIPFDRSNIYKYACNLTNLGLATSIQYSYAASLTHNNDLIKQIKDKHQEWIKQIPPQFQKQFDKVKYFNVTEYGEKFIPWAAKITNCDIQDEKEE